MASAYDLAFLCRLTLSRSSLVSLSSCTEVRSDICLWFYGNMDKSVDVLQAAASGERGIGRCSRRRNELCAWRQRPKNRGSLSKAMPKHAALYEELAPYYDQIYHWKDYRKEASKIRALIHDFQLSTGKDLLDVACGTGRHLSYLRRYFDCMGIDASEKMLRLARENAPGVQFSKGDMLDFDAGRQFDVVLCLFSSIGYLKTAGDARKALLNFANHLKKGGVMIVEPWLRKSEWRDKSVSLQSYNGDSAKIARVSFAWAKGDFSELDEHYLIGVKGKGVKHVRDLQRLKFFEVEPTLHILRKAGLDARFSDDSLMPGRGLLIATKLLG